jgi:hypothetical protein
MMVGAAWQQWTYYGDDDVEEKYELGTFASESIKEEREQSS